MAPMGQEEPFPARRLSGREGSRGVLRNRVPSVRFAPVAGSKRIAPMRQTPAATKLCRFQSGAGDRSSGEIGWAEAQARCYRGSRHIVLRDQTQARHRGVRLLSPVAHVRSTRLNGCLEDPQPGTCGVLLREIVRRHCVKAEPFSVGSWRRPCDLAKDARK
jgi:hypothetical protein